ncbi:uncharacterized protein [Trachinotus anak]|uniref:uncharacterized protein isoform X2 n=1 Tax=Trachinotus anak TaxID=443729 RepID=UPI0039F18A52
MLLHSFKKYPCIYVTKGTVLKSKIPQGHGRLRVDVTPEKVCQHWGPHCPRTSYGEKSLFGDVKRCMCGFHMQKPAAASVVQGPAEQQTATVGPVLQGTVGQPSPAGSQFTKPRFGGAHVAAAKPNLSAARKGTTTQTTDPSAESRRTSSPASIAIPTPQTDAQASAPVLPIAVCATAAVSGRVKNFKKCSVIAKTADSRTETPEASATQLARLWSEGLPPKDYKWSLKRLFKVGPRGKLELQDNLKLWYFPPQLSHIYHQAPAPDRFFGHPLLVWMPYKLWKVKVVCPSPACWQHQLTGSELHKRAWQFLDVDRMYNMVTETLTCTKCRSTHVSWSQTVLMQLDLAHRSEFPVILTQK